jgi:octaprenyl-diphosphate synthase
MHHHNTLDETRAQALFWANKAKAALAVVPEHGLKRMLIDLSDYVVARIN